MNLKFIKNKIVVAVLAGAVLAPTVQVLASETVAMLGGPEQIKKVEFNQNALIDAAKDINKSANLENALKMETSEDIKLNKMLSEKVFAVIGEEGYLAVNEAADETSACVGKIYADSVIKVVARTDEWAQVVTGNLNGFIKTEKLISGKEAIAKAKEMLCVRYPDVEINLLDEGAVENCFSVGETLIEESVRLQAEAVAAAMAEAERLAAQKAEAAEASLEKGKAIVSYARQFIGNPYVYGGSSLTRGTDCSGFVKGVYAKFGVSLPRTSYSMRKVGHAVSYSEMQPGDIVCYSGHVGIYAGNGQIVNAINERKGIGMSSATYAKIITIRRIF